MCLPRRNPVRVGDDGITSHSRAWRKRREKNPKGFSVNKLREQLDEITEKARGLLLDWTTEPTGEHHTCAHCGDGVIVRDGDDWEDGDWCHPCWQRFGIAAQSLLIDLANPVVPNDPLVNPAPTG